MTLLAAVLLPKNNALAACWMQNVGAAGPDTRPVAPGAGDKPPHAARGKAPRAEPVAALYEQGRVSHVGAFARLEDQLTTWDPASTRESPDRLDALVYAVTELMGGAPSTATAPKPVRAAPTWGF